MRQSRYDGRNAMVTMRRLQCDGHQQCNGHDAMVTTHSATGYANQALSGRARILTPTSPYQVELYTNANLASLGKASTRTPTRPYQAELPYQPQPGFIKQSSRRVCPECSETGVRVMERRLRGGETSRTGSSDWPKLVCNGVDDTVN